MRSVMIAVWLAAAAYGVPTLLAYDTTQILDLSGEGNSSQPVEFCINTLNINLHITVLINFLVLYCVPLLLITVMYTRISVLLWKSSRMLKARGELQKSLKTSRQLSWVTRKYRMDAYVSNEAESSSITDSKLYSSNLNKISRDSKDGNSSVALSRNINAPALTEEGKQKSHQSNRSDRQYDNDSVVHYGKESTKITFRNVPTDYIQTPSSRITNNTIVRNEASLSQQYVMKRRLTSKTRQHARRLPLRARRKVIRLLIAIVVSFAACMLPHHVRLLYEMWAPISYHPSFAQLLLPPFSFLLFYLNSALNPILYAFLSDNFRNKLKELMGCGRRKAATDRYAL